MMLIESCMTENTDPSWTCLPTCHLISTDSWLHKDFPGLKIYFLDFKIEYFKSRVKYRFYLKIPYLSHFITL